MKAPRFLHTAEAEAARREHADGSSGIFRRVALRPPTVAGGSLTHNSAMATPPSHNPRATAGPLDPRFCDLIHGLNSSCPPYTPGNMPTLLICIIAWRETSETISKWRGRGGGRVIVELNRGIIPAAPLDTC